MQRITRRKFLSSGITGITGMAAMPAMTDSICTPNLKMKERNIIYRTLGNTGLKVPIISMGVANTSNYGLCKAAYESGIMLFDTGHKYMNGKNEEMLGEILSSYPRNSFIISTKVYPAGEEEFTEKVNISLKRLRMDYVDLLLIHEVNNPEIFANKAIVKILKRLKKEGKARFIGFSTHKNMAVCINEAVAKGDWDVIVTSYNFKIADINAMNASLRRANEAGLGIIAMKTMAGGGWLDKEKTKPINTSAALKWALSNTDIHTSIPGMTDFDQLNMNLKVMSDLSLSEQDKKDILIAQAENGLYCSGCNNCVKSCPVNLPVPELMRAYMYAYGYSNMSKAKSLLEGIGTNEDPCYNCETCKVKCSTGFNVKEKIADISRLINVTDDFLA